MIASLENTDKKKGRAISKESDSTMDSNCWRQVVHGLPYCALFTYINTLCGSQHVLLKQNTIDGEA